MRTQKYVQELKSSLALGQYYKNIDIEFQKDEFAVMKEKFKYDLILEQLDAQKKVALAKIEAGNNPANPRDPNNPKPGEQGDILPMIGTTVEKEDYTAETFNQEREKIKSDDAKVKLNLMDYLYNVENKTNTGIPSDISLAKKKELEDNVMARIDIARKGIQSLSDGKAIIVGDKPITEKEFRENYAREISAIDAITNNEVAIKLYDDIERQVNEKTKGIEVSDDFAKMALMYGEIKVYDPKKSGLLALHTFRIPQRLKYEMQELGKKEWTDKDYKSIYNFNGIKHEVMSFDEFKNSIKEKGFMFQESGDPFLIGAKNKKQEAVDAEYQKLAETAILPSYVVQSGSGMHKDLKDVIKAQLYTKDNVVAEDKDIDFIIEKDPLSLSGYKAIALIKGEKDVKQVPVPLTPELLTRYPEFETLGSIMEIDNITTLLQRKMLSYTNPSNTMYGLNNKPSVEVQFGGKKYRITATSSTTVDLLDIQQGYPKGNISNLSYTGNNSVGSYLFDQFTIKNPNQELDSFLIDYTESINKILKDL